jgi:hypothetical protein
MEKTPTNKNFLEKPVFVLHAEKERVLYSFIGKRTIELNVKLLNDYKDNVVYAG